jgi:lysophospholipid acyltransferase (LPLAT)-like uncharacterized protein
MTEAAAVRRSALVDPRPTLGEKVLESAAWVLSLLVVGLFRIVDSSIDLHVFGYEHMAALLRASRPFLVVVWHGRGLLPVFFFQGLPLVVYSSHARDGSFQTASRVMRRLTLAALQHLGYRVLDAARFPTESRGVIRFLQSLEHGRGGVIAADGPAGPMFRAKPGAAFVAKKAGVALVPVGAGIQRAIALESWDQFELPVPFTRAALVIGGPIDVPDTLDEAGLEALSKDLEASLNDLTARAEVEAFATPVS